MTEGFQTSMEWRDILRSSLLPLCFLLFVTAVAFFDLPGHEMLVTWDDQLYVTENPAVRGFSRETIGMAFTGHYAGNYAPVQILSYILDYTLWGENPFGYFLANICYHLTSGVLLYFLLLRFGNGTWDAAFASALFLVHPVQVESVAWVSQRKNLLALLFCLTAFHAYLNYRRRPQRRAGVWYSASLALYILSLLSKSVAVVFPLMLILYEQFAVPFRRELREHVDKLPFAAAAGAAGIIALITQSPDMQGGRIPYPDHPWLTIPFTMLPVLVSYLRLLLWPDPSGLCVLYFPEVRYRVDGMVLFSAAIAAVLLLAGRYLYRKDRVSLFWYLLVFTGLLPVSQIVPLATLMNERYLYFPMVGVAGLTASWYCRLQAGAWTTLFRKTVSAVIVGIVLLLAIASSQRCRVWQNGIALFSDAAAKLPGERDPWTLLAESYLAAGDAGTAEKLYEKAETLGVLGGSDQFKLAVIYLDAGKLDKAYEAIGKLLRRDPGSPDGQMLLRRYYEAGGSAGAQLRKE